MQQNFIERRAYPRINYTSSVAIYNTYTNYYGVIKNISLCGINVELIEKLKTEEKYTFLFTIENNIKIKTIGKVKWNFLKDNIFIYGIKFLKIGFFPKIRLKRFINKLK